MRDLWAGNDFTPYPVKSLGAMVFEYETRCCQPKFNTQLPPGGDLHDVISCDVFFDTPDQLLDGFQRIQDSDVCANRFASHKSYFFTQCAHSIASSM